MSGLLGVAYIIDHEVIPRPCKICDCLLNSSHDHFGLHQGHFQCDHGVRGLQKIYFKAYTAHRHGPTSFGVGEAKPVL